MVQAQIKESSGKEKLQLLPFANLERIDSGLLTRVQILSSVYVVVNIVHLIGIGGNGHNPSLFFVCVDGQTSAVAPVCR